MYKKCVDLSEYPTELLQTVAHRYGKDPSEVTVIRDKFKWVEKVDKSETYFTLFNNSGRTIKKGEQVFYFYDGKTNRALLKDYGFAYHDNRFDCVEIFVDMRTEDPNPGKFIDLLEIT